jgi:peroxiredoxin 2/4
MRMTSMILLAALALPISSPGFPSIASADTPQRVAKVGERAPNFALDALVSTNRGKEFKKVALDDYRGKWVVLFFYPMDFTTVCPTEIRGFNQAVPTFKKLGAVVLGASTDSRYSHLAWVQRGDLGTMQFPLLSDAKKEVAAAYGCLDDKEGVSLRALYIIDPDGVLQYQVVHNLDVGRNIDEVLRVLQALQTGAQCPLGWKPGEKTFKKPNG